MPSPLADALKQIGPIAKALGNLADLAAFNDVEKNVMAEKAMRMKALDREIKAGEDRLAELNGRAESAITKHKAALADEARAKSSIPEAKNQAEALLKTAQAEAKNILDEARALASLEAAKVRDNFNAEIQKARDALAEHASLVENSKATVDHYMTQAEAARQAHRDALGKLSALKEGLP
jgi:chromosome segregation ATPase